MDVAPEDVACGKGPGHHAAEKSCHSAISLDNTLSRNQEKNNTTGQHKPRTL